MQILTIKSSQIQAGANWDSVVTVSVGILLVIGAILILALVGSRIAHSFRIKKAHQRPRRRGH